MLLVIILLVSWPRGRTQCLREAPRAWSKAERAALCAFDAPAAAACARAASKKGMRRSEVIELCAAAQSTTPADCAALLKKVPDRIALCAPARSAEATAACVSRVAPQAARRALCVGATSDAPGECFAAMRRRWTPSAAVALCEGAADAGPARCATTNARLGEAVLSKVCRGASVHAPDAPGACFAKAAPLPEAEAVRMCAGAVDAAPAECARLAIRRKNADPAAVAAFCGRGDARRKAACLRLGGTKRNNNLETAVRTCAGACATLARRALRDESDRDALCGAGEDEAPASCALAAPYAWAAGPKIALCKGLADDKLADARARCAVAAQRATPSAMIAAELCSRATDDSPAACFEDAPKAWPPEARRELCVAGGDAAACARDLVAGLARRGRPQPPDAVAELCRGAVDADAVVDCALNLTLQMDELRPLCRGADPRAAVRCVAAMPVAMPAATRARACEGAPSVAPTGPAECWRARPARHLGADALITLCKGATSATPAYCAAAAAAQHQKRQTSSSFASLAARCRAAASRPAALDIRGLAYDGPPPLAARQNFRVELGILDQFGQFLRDDRGTSVVASIPLKNSNGAILEGRRSNVSEAGIVVFDYLRLSLHGNYTLQFRFAGQDAAAAPPAASVLLVVGAAPRGDDGAFPSPAGRCGALLVAMLRCAHATTHQDEDDEATALDLAVLPQTAFALGGPLDGCEARLREAGFELLPGWAGATTWVRYRRALAWIEAAFHPSMGSVVAPLLPRSDMTPRQLLGLEPEADARRTRKAYHRLSLEWHPDRWLRFPLYAAHVQSVFELVASAYERTNGR